MKRKRRILTILLVLITLGGCSQQTESRNESEISAVSASSTASEETKEKAYSFLASGNESFSQNMRDSTSRTVSKPQEASSPETEHSIEIPAADSRKSGKAETPTLNSTPSTQSPSSTEKPKPSPTPKPASIAESTPQPKPTTTPSPTPISTPVPTPDPTPEPAPATNWDYDTVVAVAISNCTAEWNEKAMDSGCTVYSSDSAGSAEDMGLLIAATVNRSGRKYFYVATDGDYWYVYK